MDLMSTPFTGNWRRYWRRKRYQKLDGGLTGRKNTKMVRFGGGRPRRSAWKIRPKLKILKIAAASPLKLVRKVKNAYVDMMLNLAGSVGFLNDDKVFGNKRIPKARQAAIAASYSNEEFEARLVYEIYKALKATK
ncbi:uncharacterized protein LOC110609647 [Manihot esculenta]|uniref:Uncharacterized protein n=1 Tax=Manihot esculenta TaxID=3983 RepID=A0A2C9WBM8_MANES|nr:uncharacterized protein LOC110609647 [Manihot esculenta]OAY57119.1 hypothetical protein MANES_02G072000v8 [Manihot esculenta]